jgi:hypothetical protein
MSLVSLAAGLLSGGVGFLLSVLLGGAALAGAWLAVTVTVSAGAGLASGALAVKPGGRQARPTGRRR